MLLLFSILLFSKHIISFDYSKQKVRGVSIGGWLVLEPWITPSLFKQFENTADELTAVDEYTFTKILGKEEASKLLIKHWDTFLKEEHIAKLSQSGINHIRIPIGYWIFGGLDQEPWVNGSFPFLLRAIGWAKKHKLNVMIDMHGAPGSQNGFDNSGKRGKAEWFKDEGSIQRVTDILVVLSKIFNEEKYKDTVTAIELINEPAHWLIDFERIKRFHLDSYKEIRKHNDKITIVLHDSFKPLNESIYLKTSPFENVVLDTHIYQVFTTEFNQMSRENHLLQSCGRRQELQKINSIVPTVVGEFTLATNDCAKWLNGFKVGSRYEGNYLTDKPVCENCKCSEVTNIENFDDEFMKKIAMQQISIYEKYAQGWFFWNFRTENSPDWDFLYALEKGWINLSLEQEFSC